jgi:integrase
VTRTSRAKRKRLTTRNDGTPVSGQGCSVVHDLRHTFATLALSAGEHYMQVSKWLGHSTFTLTLDVYGDYISSAEGGKAAPLARPVAASAITNVVPIDRRAQ